MDKTPEQLVQTLANNLANKISRHYEMFGAKASKPTFTTTMKAKRPAGNTRHFAGKNSPVGTIVQTGQTHDTVMFDAMDLLAWCAANGAQVDIVVTEQPAGDA